MILENFDLSFLGIDLNNGLFYTYTVDGDGYGTDGTIDGNGCGYWDYDIAWYDSFMFIKF